MHEGRQGSKLWMAAALLAGLLLRLCFVQYLNRIPNDFLLYADIARNWFQHGVYGFTNLVDGHTGPPRPTLIRLPGYPFFLGLCFTIFGPSALKAILLVQTGFDLLTCTLTASIAGRLFGPRGTLPALWLGALCPFLANYCAVPLTETLTVFTVALAFWALLRWQMAGAGMNRWVPVIAGALSYSLLLRPEQGLMSAAIIPAMLWIGFVRDGRKAFGPAAAAALLTLLPLVPWTVRNERTFHIFQPLAPRSATDPGGFVPVGFQRWYRTWGVDYASTETAYWPYDNDEIHTEDLPGRAFDSPAQRAETKAILDDYNLHTTATPALDLRFDALARERIAASPARYFVLLPAERVLNMTLRPDTSFLPLPLLWWKLRLKPWLSLLAYTLLGFRLAYLSTAAIGWSRRKSLIRSYRLAAPVLCAMAASIILRSALLLTIDNSEPRYTLEFYPVLIVFAAGWISAVGGLRRGAACLQSR